MPEASMTATQELFNPKVGGKMKTRRYFGKRSLFWWGMLIVGFGYYLVAISQKRRHGFLYRKEGGK